uniref:Uncharacterized protein n=1 Tax=Onchocerca volvulus TaxID=6282 RepID=A0A8R1TIT2_ONCVO
MKNTRYVVNLRQLFAEVVDWPYEFLLIVLQPLGSVFPSRRLCKRFLLNHDISLILCTSLFVSLCGDQLLS